MVSLATVSDIHGYWDSIHYPKADFLIYAGDLFDDYSRFQLISASCQLQELERFNIFLGNLKQKGLYSEIIVIAGNHDFVFEKIPECRNLLTNAYYLQNSSIVLNGIKFYGSPQTVWYHNWAFNLPCGSLKHNGDPEHARKVAEACWGNIPNDVEVLITHGPPMGILDSNYEGTMIGCPVLEERIEHLTQLQAHIFGHVHHSYGRTTKTIRGRQVQFVNTAICADLEIKPINPIPIIQL